jgi:hypothetical protein
VLTSATGNDVSTVGLFHFDSHQTRRLRKTILRLAAVLRAMPLETGRMSDIISVRQLL